MFFRYIKQVAYGQITMIICKLSAKGQEASPHMRHEKACKHHLQHNEAQDRISGGESSNRASSKLI